MGRFNRVKGNLLTFLCALVFTLIIAWIYSFFIKPFSIAEPIDESESAACLYIQKHLYLVQFDGQPVYKAAGFGARSAAVNVPEGAHNLIFKYYEYNPFVNTITADGLELNITFESGQYYYVNYIKEMNPVRITIYSNQTEEGVYSGPMKQK